MTQVVKLDVCSACRHATSLHAPPFRRDGRCGFGILWTIPGFGPQQDFHCDCTEDQP